MDGSRRRLSGWFRRRLALAALMLVGAASVAVAQSHPGTTSLEKRGWDALAAGHSPAAAEAFHEALTRDPRNPRLHLGAGAAAYNDRRDAEAREALECALALDPHLPGARMLLGRVQHRTGDLKGAIATVETLVAEAPSAVEARAMLERWRQEAVLQDRSRQLVGPAFTVSFGDAAAEALATAALASLERAYWRVGTLLGTFPNQPISVVVYAPEDFAVISRAPEWAAGSYDGTIRVPIRAALGNPAELDRVLAHEFVHALVDTLARRGVPEWLNEGLATALESDGLGWAERRVRNAPVPVPLHDLISGFTRLNGDEARLAYATSALAVRRLLDDAGGVAMTNLLRDLGKGIDLETAFVHRMHQSLTDFETGGSAF